MFIRRKNYLEVKENFLNKIIELKNENNDISIKLINKDSTIEDLKEKVDSKNKTIKEQDAKICELKNRIEDNTKVIFQAANIIQELKRANHNLKISNGLFKKNKKRSSLEKKEFLKLIDEYQNMNSKLEKEIKSLKNKPTIEELKFSSLKIDKKKYKGFRNNKNAK